MGIDAQVFKFLNYCYDYGKFKETLTVARQEIHTHINGYSGYCEKMLNELFGSNQVDSIDNSNYEQASIIWDLNKLIPDNNQFKEYDTVLDLGTLEHVYNIPNAFYNLSKLCKVGGQIIHILPANNFCGHGFWQISPELPFSLYTKKNGYDKTEVFVLDADNLDNVKKLDPPTNGNRVTIDGPNKIYLGVRTTIKKKPVIHENIQQSDYVYYWNK